MRRTFHIFTFILFICSCSWTSAFSQKAAKISAVSASINEQTISKVLDENSNNQWTVAGKQLEDDQFIMLTTASSGDIIELQLETDNLTQKELEKLLSVYVTYDPMNLGEAAKYSVSGTSKYILRFPPKYGAHVKLEFKGNIILHQYAVKNIKLIAQEEKSVSTENSNSPKPWLNTRLSATERAELILDAMTPEEKLELIRESWGIPGVKRLGIPPVTKVEAIHGYSYGSGATIYPQSIGMGASFDKQLTEEVAIAIAKETKAANTIQAWSPVLDVAQDPRWGRCEETYGEDPFLVSTIGGAWIKGYQSEGLWTTPKHFGVHGSQLGGRDSHDIGLSEREIREIHLVPFRNVIKKYNCQSIMMSYNDFNGVPVAKSRELLYNILREEWGFNGFIVSDCGAIRNLTSTKHYTAQDALEAAEQALAAGISTNCGNTYNDPLVKKAAEEGKLNQENLDNVCRYLLITMLRNGIFETNPAKPLDWNKQYDGWNSKENRAIARRAAQKTIVMLKNDIPTSVFTKKKQSSFVSENKLLPLSKNLKTIAVVGPGSDQPQTGDYTYKNPGDQVVSVLRGIQEAVSPETKVLHERGCEFFKPENYNLNAALKIAKQADVVVMVGGDCSTSHNSADIINTSGENHDYASLVLPGNQQQLLEALCETGKPVVLVLQAGRPYNLSYAAEHCAAILVNWFPGQEGGYATADVIFGDYNPAGRLPMTFPKSVAQVPCFYNFKTSGRRYEYTDMEFYPLFQFGYGLSYTTFEYSNLKIEEKENGNVEVQATVKNTGKCAGEEVAQLYVTDMYASVKTRVMELKGFDRLALRPNESKIVKFTLTPYDISILNDKMDRVVEPGSFKIVVGGKSPSYVAKDKIKDSVGFLTSAEGVNGSLDYTKSFRADFDIAYNGIKTDLKYNKLRISVDVTNKGNITDCGKIDLYIDGEKQDETHHFEIDPDGKQTITFDVNNNINPGKLMFVTKYKVLEKSL